MNLMPFLILLGLLAITVLVLFMWRRSVAKNEDDTLHVLETGVQRTVEQASVAQKLELIDKWGKTLTVVTVVYGLILAGLFLYQTWVQNATVGV
jgi:hypothetical protein